MNIVFLDFDGILNCQHYFVNRPKDDDDPYPFSEISKENVKWLNYIIENIDNTKVVVSSAWRIGRTVEELQGILNRRGFVGEIIDTTPSFYKPSLSYDFPRGCEIDHWLKNNGGFDRITWSKSDQLKNLDRSAIKNYVILDDDMDMLLSQKEHFVKCNAYNTGLGQIEADQACRILHTSIMDLYFDNYDLK